MHEFAICEQLTHAVLEEHAKLGDGPRLLRVRVVVGALQQIVPENLRQAYDVLVSGTSAEGSVLEITSVPVRLRCGDCDSESLLGDSGFLCTCCESRDVKVVSGRELHLTSLEIDDGD